MPTKLCHKAIKIIKKKKEKGSKVWNSLRSFSKLFKLTGGCGVEIT